MALQSWVKECSARFRRHLSRGTVFGRFDSSSQSRGCLGPDHAEPHVADRFSIPADEMKTEMARTVVIGTSCSGKTSFARDLARALGSPHIELEALHWQPNWVPRPAEEFSALTAQAVSQDNWVVDGNYAIVRDLVWSRATTIIWLNYSFSTVMWRALARTFRRALTGEELFSGNRESLRMACFSRDSILCWVITTFHRRRKDYRRLFDTRTLSQLVYVEFGRPLEAETFLARLQKK